MLEDYRKCAQLCKNTDYGSKASVSAHNRAVKKMYKIVEKTAKKGREAIKALATLLDDPLTKEWLAFQLVEEVSVEDDIKDKCLLIIRSLAAKDDTVSILGARMWLEKWDAKNKSK